jgi:hypothetical protein
MEMGALIAGVALSTFPYALDVTAKVTTLRDFFLTLFFVALSSSGGEEARSHSAPSPSVVSLHLRDSHIFVRFVFFCEAILSLFLRQNLAVTS